MVTAEQQRTLVSKSRINDPEVNRYLASISEPIIVAARELDGVMPPEPGSEPGQPKLPSLYIYDKFDVYLVQEPMPNAWAVGDDFACLTTTALLQADHPEEVAFVLCHEFGHIRREHMVRSVERRYETQFAAALAAGLAGAAAGINASSNRYYTPQQYQQDMRNAMALGNAIVRSYSPHRKEDEFEADAQAVELMVGAGYTLNHVTDFLERTQTLYGDGGGKTHPQTSERIERLRKLVATYPNHHFAKRSLETSELRRIQEVVRGLSQKQVQEKTITFYSVERPTLAPQAVLPPLQSCGPLDADLQRVSDNYVKLLTRPRP